MGRVGHADHEVIVGPAPGNRCALPPVVSPAPENVLREVDTNTGLSPLGRGCVVY